MDKQLAAQLLEKMLICRKFEESVQYYFSLGMIHGTTHLGIGEEASAAGSCLALDRNDAMYATHRGHSAAICKGVDVKRMMAEIFGKATGVCKGHGGSMHIADAACGAMGSNGIVGPSSALACGSAFAFKNQGKKNCAAAFLGDGAMNEGVVHEAMNLASVWNLPVLFLCINNQYGMSTHISKVMKNTDIAARAKVYDMKSVTVDGNDAYAVFEAVSGARKTAVENSEPFLVVMNSYRISGHSKSDGNQYRTKEEIQHWKQLDPIRLFKEKVLSEGTLTSPEILDIEKRAESLISESVQFAIDSPFPGVEDIYEDVYSE